MMTLGSLDRVYQSMTYMRAELEAAIEQDESPELRKLDKRLRNLHMDIAEIVKRES